MTRLVSFLLLWAGLSLGAVPGAVQDCAQSSFPACDGLCPAGQICGPAPSGSACACEPIPCESSGSPICGGVCSTGLVCTSGLDSCQCEMPVAQLEISKSGSLDLGPDSSVGPGDLVSYELLFENAGNVIVANVSIDDPLINALNCTTGNPIAGFAPGASGSCSGSYAITQGDIDAARVDNTATIQGEYPAGVPVSDTALDTVAIPWDALVGLVKSGAFDNGGDGSSDVGDLVAYTFEISNLGNVTLTAVTLADDLVTFTCDAPHPFVTLAPGSTESCAATHAVSQEEIDAGVVINIADVEATDPGLGAVQALDVEKTSIPNLFGDGFESGDTSIWSSCTGCLP